MQEYAVFYLNEETSGAYLAISLEADDLIQFKLDRASENRFELVEVLSEHVSTKNKDLKHSLIKCGFFR